MFARTFRAAASAPTLTRAFSSTPRPALARMSIVGRLGTAPEEIVVSGDRTLVRYNVGTSHGRGDNEKTSWFRVANFPTSEKQKEYLMSIPKGALVFVDADARMESYTDAEGNKKSNLSLIASKFEGGSERGEGVKGEG
jgi:single-stranded DNA-binding protein